MHEEKSPHLQGMSRSAFASYLTFSSTSNSLRASQVLTVFTTLFLPSFSAHSSWSSTMLTWAKRNLPSATEVKLRMDLVFRFLRKTVAPTNGVELASTT